MPQEDNKNRSTQNQDRTPADAPMNQRNAEGRGEPESAAKRRETAAAHSASERKEAAARSESLKKATEVASRSRTQGRS